MVPDLKDKIRDTLIKGVTSESLVVYLLVELRKHFDRSSNSECILIWQTEAKAARINYSHSTTN